MTHLELKKTLKMHFALNLSADNKFYLNRAFKGLYWLPCGSSKVVYILNEYLNMSCVIVSQGTHLELKQTLKSHFAQKPSPFNNLFLNQVFKELFWHGSDFGKVF